jgi:pyruvate/2-oxoglutarate/acetoin dehydrogenase E1 component
MGKYQEALTEAMTWLGNKKDTLFIGQAVEYKGTAMTGTLVDVPDEKKIELPVMEETQMGMTVGLTIAGYRPISIFPRWNFLICGTNQLVNHLDKLELMAPEFPRGAIIRVGVGAEKPIHPQHQHVGDFTKAFSLLCPHTFIEELNDPEKIVKAYKAAYKRNRPSLMVEWGDYYNEK